MTFKEAMGIVSNNMKLRAILPDWAMNLRPQWRLAKTAYEEMRVRARLISKQAAFLNVLCARSCT